MVMDQPSPQSVGREFVRQYYTMLHEAPHFLHRFYSHDSSFLHESVGKPGDEQQPAVGQAEIFKKIELLNFRDCHAKIRQVDSQLSVSGSVVIQVVGELSNNGVPLRRFMQTFVLAPQSPKKFYVHNDIFRYQDEIFEEIDVVDDEDANAVRYYESEEDKQEAFDQHHQQQQHFELQQQQQQQYVAIQHQHIEATEPQQNFKQMQESKEGGGERDTDEPINKQELNGEYHHGDQVDDHHGDIGSNVDEATVEKEVEIVIANETQQAEPQSTQQQETNNEQNIATDCTSNKEVTTSTNENEANKSHVDEQQHGLVGTSTNQTTEQKTSVATEKPSWAAMLRQGVATTTSSSSKQAITPIAKQQPQQSGKQQLVPAISNNTPTTAISSSSSGVHQSAFKNSRMIASSNTSTTSTPLSTSTTNNAMPSSRSGDDDDTSSMQQYPDNQQIFVGNLPHNMTDVQLKEFFQQFGQVLDMRINRKVNNNLPNFGFVVFDSPDTVQTILKSRPLYNGKHRVNVEEKKCREDLFNNRPRSSNKQQQKFNNNNNNATTGNNNRNNLNFVQRSNQQHKNN